jgi:hypothetical protein
MAPSAFRADDNDDHVFAVFQIRIPSREPPGAAEPFTSADLIGIRERSKHPVAMLREQVRVAFGDMQLALVAQLDLAIQVPAKATSQRAI